MSLRKLQSFFLISILFFTVTGWAQQNTLTVVFKGITSGKGFLMIRVLDEEGKDVEKKRLRLTTASEFSYDIRVPEGRYALQVYQDENGNGKLDKNMVGIPSEKYGFSNNARGAFGPPDLDDQLVEVRKDLKISVDLR